MYWRLSVTPVLLVVMATGAAASWKWDESNTTSLASTVTSSPSLNSTLSSATTVSKSDAQITTESLNDTSLTDDPPEGTSLLESQASDTEPRFIGGLKKKLCSVGLGINNGVLFECKRAFLKKKVRTTRDAQEDKAENNEQTPRLFDLLGGLVGGSGLDGIFKGPAFVPSFGVNFGSLPTGGGYGPYGTPYGGGSNPLGLDLGPVSINPFVGFKVAKFDGRPVFNPSLDLLVTPNAEGVHAIESIKNGLNPFGGGVGGVGGGFGPGPGPYPGGPYPYPGGIHQQGAGYYPGGGGYPNYPAGGLYPQTGGLYPQTGGLYPQTGGIHPPIYSPNTYKPPSTPYVPPYAPSRPSYTPSRPAYTPSYTPSRPAYTPPYTPSRPAYTPPYTPSRPSYSPQIYTPPVTSINRPLPVADFSNQPHNNPLIPSRPSFTPSRPLHSPSSFLHDEKPVEVHHHEHTHFHDHDHDHDDDFYNPNNFGTVFRGRGGKLDDKRDSLLSDRRPLSNSASSFTPSTSSDRFASSVNSASSFSPSSSSSTNRFVLPQSSLTNSLLDPRSLDSDKSSRSGSSFRFPDK